MVDYGCRFLACKHVIDRAGGRFVTFPRDDVMVIAPKYFPFRGMMCLEKAFIDHDHALIRVNNKKLHP